MFPMREPAIVADSAGDVDDAGRPTIRPGEFLLPRPDKFDRFARGAGESSRFHRRFTGVLSAVPGAGVWHDDANIFFRHPKSGCEFAPHAKGPLGSRPDG